MNKIYYTQQNIGKAKYTVSFFNGKSKHKDGSNFYAMRIFKNKKDNDNFINELHKQGYKMR